MQQNNSRVAIALCVSLCLLTGCVGGLLPGPEGSTLLDVLSLAVSVVSTEFPSEEMTANSVWYTEELQTALFFRRTNKNFYTSLSTFLPPCEKNCLKTYL